MDVPEFSNHCAYSDGSGETAFAHFCQKQASKLEEIIVSLQNARQQLLRTKGSYTGWKYGYEDLVLADRKLALAKDLLNVVTRHQ